MRHKDVGSKQWKVLTMQQQQSVAVLLPQWASFRRWLAELAHTKGIQLGAGIRKNFDYDSNKELKYEEALHGVDTQCEVL